ncbi:MAG TPA: hypothetical protein VK656_01820 [Candidatus Acidoferrum sp.]|nr:hypothetical protein [Candidatus Acidoferrum sp.]
MSLFPVILVLHIALAVGLFVPSLLLPFTLRTNRSLATSRGTVVQGLLAMQGTGSVVVGGGVAITGVLLVASLGARLLEQPWLLVALAIYAVDLILAFAIQRPNLRRLVGATTADDATWRARARRQRYVSYAMAGLVGAIGWLMSAKPALW